MVNNGTDETVAREGCVVDGTIHEKNMHIYVATYEMSQMYIHTYMKARIIK